MMAFIAGALVSLSFGIAIPDAPFWRRMESSLVMVAGIFLAIKAAA